MVSLGNLTPNLDDEEDAREPEVKPIHNGLFCFLNTERPCGSDCMAFTLNDSESPALGTQQKSCVLLVSVERLSRSTAGISSLVHKMQQASANEAADRIRASQKPPPDPKGTRP